jgi:hypothetical protein
VVGAPDESSVATTVNGNQSNNSSQGSGAAYVFVRNAGVWTQQAYLKESNTRVNNRFGKSVALSGDTVVVGAPQEDAYSGAAYVFVRNAGVWTQQGHLKESNPRYWSFAAFGYFLGVSGNTVVVGGSFRGAYVFVSTTPDLNGDRNVDCTDMAIVRAAFGTRSGQARFDPRADVVLDGVIDIRDLTFVSQRLPAGTVCQ